MLTNHSCSSTNSRVWDFTTLTHTMGLEREQAERDQQRALAADDWIMESSQLGDGIDPQAFSMIGNLLNSQSLSQEPRFTSDSSSQTLAVATTSASTLTAPPAPAPRAGTNTNTNTNTNTTNKRRILFGLLAACVAMLLGTGTYCAHLRGRNRFWEAENASLRAKIARLEAGGSPDAATTPPSCPGGQLIDTCWFKVGWGDCTKEVFEDPVKPLEDAARYAWDSTAEVIGAVTDTVASDLRQVCDAMQSFGRFIFEL